MKAKRKIIIFSTMLVFFLLVILPSHVSAAGYYCECDGKCYDSESLATCTCGTGVNVQVGTCDDKVHCTCEAVGAKDKEMCRDTKRRQIAQDCSKENHCRPWVPGPCPKESAPAATTQPAVKKADQSKIIPECALSDPFSPGCKDVSIFVEMGIKIANYLFSIIGALALAAFIYGGFYLIISGGNQEKIKTGMGAMMSAVIGLVVAFSGYLLVGFLASAMGVSGVLNLLQ